MNVPSWLWLVTVVTATALLLIDVFIIGRRPHEPSTRECVRYLVFYVGLAVLFGLGVWIHAGSRYGAEFFAGWLTEYSLSVDNLFVFLILLKRFSVPRKLQQSALLIGIILALIFRGIFIAVGAAAIDQFNWVFYFFGAFLIFTAIKLAREGETGEEDVADGRLIRLVRSKLPVASDFHGVKLSVKVDGRRLLTPMFLVLLALGTTDLLFALDSIPAIYGLTSEPYLVLMANIFALMGLRQLYFLIGDLLQRLVYLSLGLSFLLFFIGVKLVLHALHENDVSWINGGAPFKAAPEIPIWLSLTVIGATLAVTTIASIARSRQLDRS